MATRLEELRVLILGAGGHAQVVADILLRMHDTGEPLKPIGFLDDDPKLAGKILLGLPVLGTLDDCSTVPHDSLIVAIGDNSTRMRLFQQLTQKGEYFSVARHPRSIVAPDVPLGEGSMICAGVVINTRSIVGGNVILNTGCTVDHHNQIGDYVHIGPGAHLGGEVTIGEGALVGIGSVVLPRKRIGVWSIVGAGAVVTEDVPDGVVVAGVPAKVIKEAKLSGLSG